MATLDRAARSFLLTELLSGMWTTLKFFFRPKATIAYPNEKAPLSPRFRGEHALRRYPNGEERCIACKLCEAVCPAKCIVIEAEPRATAAAHHPLRHRHDEVHLLRLCEEACPVDAIVEGRTSSSRSRRGRAALRQGQLLANGDRWEPELAKRLELDAPYR
jgi:NADH-quinone oxidoreductase subunit I